MGRRGSVVSAVLAVSLVVRPVFAAPDEPSAPSTESADAKPSTDAVKEARAHYERGTILYNDTDFKLALIEFKRAYELAPNYRILYNIGQVNLQMGKYADALNALEKYLEQGASEIPAPRKKQVEKDIASLKARTAHITVTTNVAKATVQIDDTTATSPVNALLVDAGQVRITVSKDGYQMSSRTVTLAPADDAKVQIDLTKVEEKPPVVVTQVHNYGSPTSYLWVGWVASGALAAGAVTTGILSLSAKKALERDLNDQSTPSELDSHRERARTLGYVTDALIVGSVLAAGVTLYFTLKKPAKGKGDVRVGFDPGAVRVSGSF